MRLGYSEYYAYVVFKKTFDDLFKNKNRSWKEKTWAFRHGFWTRKMRYYNLNDANVKDFLPDFSYYKLHPINGFFSRWIDDKLTLRYLLAPFSEHLPSYYYHLFNGEILKLPDCPTYLGTSNEDIVQLIHDKETLAVKPFAGSKGYGFHKLSLDGGSISLNNKQIKISELNNQIADWKSDGIGGFIVMEYLHPCVDLADIWPETANTIRIVMLRNKDKKPKVVDSYIRFGTTKSGVVDNMSQGSVFCKINIEDGKFSDGHIFGEDKEFADHEYHPESRKLLKGCIPHWNLIIDKLVMIGEYIPQVVWMGFDIVVTENGFKILEINSHQAIDQSNKPYLKEPDTKEFFENRMRK